MTVRFIAAVLALAATGASAQTDLATAFGAREQIEQISLSPDGSRLAYIVPTKGQGSALLTYAPGIDKEPKVALVMNGEPDRLSGCNWIANDRLVCGIWGLARPPQLATAGIIPYSRVVAIDANGGNPRMLSTTGNSASRGFNLRGGEVIDWLPDEDGSVLMTRLQLPDSRLGTRLGKSEGGMTLDKINTRNLNAARLETAEENIATYLSDRRGTLRIKGVAQRNEAGRDTGVTRYYYRQTGSKKWEPLSDYNYVTDAGFEPDSVDYERNAVYGFRKKDGRKAIYRRSLDGSLREELVFARPDVDVDGVVHIGRRNRVIGASYATDVRQANYFDADLAKLRESLAKALPKQPNVRIVDSSVDEKKLLIWAGSDDDPGVYYILDRTTKEMAIFQPARPQLEGVRLGEMKPVSYPAADGTMIPGYLTLPAGSAGKNLPTIVMPHGGPSARDEWGFDWLAQYYAARGFAVLQPNFRGSSGYGEDWFLQNGFKSWPTAIGDIDDGARWLIKQGIADPKKLGVVGWSYGGYAALQSAVVDPALFKAVVAIAPVTDLPLLKEDSRWWSDYRIVSDYIGSGPQIQQGSPARNAARIKVPVMLFHGTMDRNVDVEQTRVMDKALTAAGVPHKTVIFENRDHQIEDSEMRAQMLRESDAFLRQSMGM
ncbi:MULTISPECIES: S9 family peptidase [unclassified Sphingomonas]|uniref:S9 family peptidase n=1 Tax=unclassified Sphingomonas TaxID=196159 RepID=UPI0006F6E731|nr:MULTISPECIES: S9 family peptidase [unclassified Sphingomonas]KQX19581.1 peptidase S9 [Sphingomonas sp. Root1294]KQY65782.1 peptidase S9 [Sphingomonas sp. Root50]KRB94912.1 peptidase S9 [Sphingomonas sp. Root720]